MTEYNGRRAPNFSQYLDDLNAIPSPYDQAIQQQQQGSYNLDADLSLFTNAEFFDFDNFGDLNLPGFDSVESDNLKKENNQATGQNPDMEFLDLLGGFNNMPEYSATGFNSVNAQPQPTSLQNAQFSTVPQMQNGPLNAASSPTESISTSSPSPAAQSQAPGPAASSSAPGPKRKNTQKPAAISVEEASRVAAEEDKRRRNTAASARFRVKKKMREQALEKTVKETTEKNTALEARVTALELENQWLKNLITEKNGQSSEEGKKSENDIADMFKKFLASQKAEGQRSSAESRFSVGTA
ncbi:bZIP transcription factor (MetR) [Aspergillus bombycis]|uniref:BZIP transcription factor (MetR) n=1 Tax=Aspergillus bombycis TaxID=109264 RepID=A0A1F7ZY72_9EURO|nr:bZIP transcription factor (MetR) [Aspergillus bombycis]OGM44390.1 bZIP transcription factor (MetR) [Aspergillus bombycis]